MTAIDRPAVVRRHNVQWNELNGLLPLGNGEFCVGIDGTGLQTFCGNSMSHWGWHSFPLPAGCTCDDIPATGTVDRGRITGPMRNAAHKRALDEWIYQNPHIVNLGRLRLCRCDGGELKESDIAGLVRGLDLWSGEHTASYRLDGQSVRVTTCVHPTLDAVAVRIESPLLASGAIGVALDFPYPDIHQDRWVGHWGKPDAHRTSIDPLPDRHRVDILRTVDSLRYHVACQWSGQAALRSEPAGHALTLVSSNADSLEFVCAFARDSLPEDLPTFQQARHAAANGWERYWRSGGAIDLSASRDSRWKELERRVVLSQYLMGTQSAGTFPPAEMGLIGIDCWMGQFHMEMIWWHLAHYALWDRWDCAKGALACYRKFLPVARNLARQFDYQGASGEKWSAPRVAPPNGPEASCCIGSSRIPSSWPSWPTGSIPRMR